MVWPGYYIDQNVHSIVCIVLVYKPLKVDFALELTKPIKIKFVWFKLAKISSIAGSAPTFLYKVRINSRY